MRTGCATTTGTAVTATGIWCAPSPTRTPRPSSSWSENGVQFQDQATGPQAASTVRRQGRTVQWPIASERVTHHVTRVGSGLVRALEKSARAKGAEILLEHRMTRIIRENQFSGRVLGVSAEHRGTTLNIRALKGVLVATGGSSSNVTLRRTFDPRLTESIR